MKWLGLLSLSPLFIEETSLLQINKIHASSPLHPYSQGQTQVEAREQPPHQAFQNFKNFHLIFKNFMYIIHITPLKRKLSSVYPRM